MTKIFAVAAKDLRSEVRAKEIAPAMVLFALVLVFLTSLILPPSAGRAPIPTPQAGAIGTLEVAAAMFWISVLFAGIVGFGRAAALEKEGNLIDALALSPADPAAVFAGKALANFVYLTLLEAIIIPFFIVMLDVSVASLLPRILIVMVVANIGLSAVGTMFGTATQYSRAKELVFPLLLFPIILPVVLGSIRLTGALLATGTFSGESQWFILLATFDLVFATLGAVTYEYLINE